MAALTEDRATPERIGDDFVDPVAAGAVFHAGALVVLDAAGNAAPATAAAGLISRGVAQEAADNSGGADGDISVAVRKGVFPLANGGAITRANIGDPAYIVDDQSVTEASAGSSAVGTIVDVDAEGVWVRIG